MKKFNLNEFDMTREEKDTPVSTPVIADKTAGIAVHASPAIKVPMMNIRFSPENYDYMRREAAIRGLSVIKFTNWIIDQYRSDLSHVHQNDLYQNENNW